jgi:hypothetical protein
MIGHQSVLIIRLRLSPCAISLSPIRTRRHPLLCLPLPPGPNRAGRARLGAARSQSRGPPAMLPARLTAWRTEQRSIARARD